MTVETVPTRVEDPAAWDACVGVYEEAFEELTSIFGAQALEHLPLRPGDHLLDVAAGAGALALMAAERQWNVTAVDFAPRFVDRIRARAHEAGHLAQRVDAQVMDGCALQLEEATFDGACSVFGLMFFQDRPAGYREVLRVLKPGARFIHVVWGAPDENDAQVLMSQALTRAGLQLPAAPPPAWVGLSVPGQAERELEGAGFVQVEGHRVGASWSVPSAQWLWERLPRISPVSASLFQTLGAGEMARMREAYLQTATERYGSESFALRASARIVSGRRHRT